MDGFLACLFVVVLLVLGAVIGNGMASGEIVSDCERYGQATVRDYRLACVKEDK